jgi:hypothetical protein
VAANISFALQYLRICRRMLNKIEHKTRDVSHIEVRELVKVLQTTVAELDSTASELEAGRSHPVTEARAKRPRRKR